MLPPDYYSSSDVVSENSVLSRVTRGFFFFAQGWDWEKKTSAHDTSIITTHRARHTKVLQVVSCHHYLWYCTSSWYHQLHSKSQNQWNSITGLGIYNRSVLSFSSKKYQEATRKSTWQSQRRVQCPQIQRVSHTLVRPLLHVRYHLHCTGISTRDRNDVHLLLNNCEYIALHLWYDHRKPTNAHSHHQRSTHIQVLVLWGAA